jgi:autotransporter strand-loop-strand O-heptosyltransferase
MFKNSQETKQQYIDVINNTQIILREESPIKIKINQHFVDGAFLEISGNSNSDFRVEFWDGDKIDYNTTIRCGMWSRTNRKYFIEWVTKVYCNSQLIYEDKFNLKGKRALISIDSRSLGDNIAWMPYIEEFRKKHDCQVIASTFWNKLFKNVYPDIEFIEPGTTVNNLYSSYMVGWFYNLDKEPITPPNIIPLQKSATNILGLSHVELKTKLDFTPKDRPIQGKYVTIATESTAAMKYWNNPTGWQEVITFLQFNGYEVVNVSLKGAKFLGVHNISDDSSIENTMNYIHHSEFLIGLGSGLSWLAWAMNKHVVLISGFSLDDHEFTTNCTRISNRKVCNGCWNDKNFRFDKGDWWWCPNHKDTTSHFECHKLISGDMVIDELKKLLKFNI